MYRLVFKNDEEILFEQEADVIKLSNEFQNIEVTINGEILNFNGAYPENYEIYKGEELIEKETFLSDKDLSAIKIDNLQTKINELESALLDVLAMF